MVIRCERCSTLYELDEALLSPSGSQVQCTRCQHVFTAFPPRAAGRTLVGMPAQDAGDGSADVPERPAVPRAGRRTPVPAPAMAGAGEAAAGAAAPRNDTPRAVRTGPPPVYRPSAASAPPTTGRAPLLRRDTVGTFENRLRWSARMRWLAPLAAVAVLGVAVAAWILVPRRSDPEAARSRADAMSLVALDDVASLEQAISRLDAVLRRSPKQRGAASERALAYVLRAASLTEEGEALSARLAARRAEREALTRDQPPGWEQADRSAAADVQKLEPEVRAREERAKALGAAAFQALKKLQADQGDGPDVARGLAAYFALGGDRANARKIVRAARERAPADPWLDLSEAWVDAREPDRGARERALVQLGALSVAHPELLRARYLLARTEAALGRQREAVATLDALLAANVRHEAGKRLRDELTAPPPLPPPPPAPEARPEPLRRKLVTHSVPAPAPVPKVTVLPPLTPLASERQGARSGSGAGTGSGPPPADAAQPAGAPGSGAAAPASGAPGATPGDAPPPRPETRRERESSPFPEGG